MPRVVKKKTETTNKKPAAGLKKKNGYIMPHPLPLGEVLTDMARNQWKVGSSIGCGGFGEIYSACKAAASAQKRVDDYDHVVKIEPHGNGPLFVEMHFYMRNAKLDDIKAFCKKKGVKNLGMPHFIGNGSHDLHGDKHRFLIMPRYGKDIWSFFLANGRRLPQHTIYRIAIQMLEVYEYIHTCTYVHADLKGANILLGYGKQGLSQAYLIDFGLASHYTTKDFKPDPKKMHNGTIEYTSRDAHLGVPTMRGDFEVLGYNLVHWSGVQLPWEKDKLLSNPQKVQKSKEEFMKNIDLSFKNLFGKSIPGPIHSFLKYVSTLEYNESPNYAKCREMFILGLKSMNKPNSGELDFKASKSPATVKSTQMQVDSSEDESEEEEPIPTAVPKLKRPVAASPKRSVPIKKTPMKTKSPPKRTRVSPRSGLNSSVKRDLGNTSGLKINFSPKVEINNKNATPRSGKKYGATVVNDNITPTRHSQKTYQFNLELDVSMDANVIVSVKRKQKLEPMETKRQKNRHNNSGSEDDEIIPDSNEGTPVPRVHVRRVYKKS